MLFICYPKCTTCQKAQKWLTEQGAQFQVRNIKEENPTAEELRTWWTASGLPLKKFFNTSGLQYDGMLVKRPILVGEGFVRVGFREQDWEAAL